MTTTNTSVTNTATSQNANQTLLFVTKAPQKNIEYSMDTKALGLDNGQIKAVQGIWKKFLEDLSGWSSHANNVGGFGIFFDSTGQAKVTYIRGNRAVTAQNAADHYFEKESFGEVNDEIQAIIKTCQESLTKAKKSTTCVIFAPSEEKAEEAIKPVEITFSNGEKAIEKSLEAISKLNSGGNSIKNAPSNIAKEKEKEKEKKDNKLIKTDIKNLPNIKTQEDNSTSRLNGEKDTKQNTSKSNSIIELDVQKNSLELSRSKSTTLNVDSHKSIEKPQAIIANVNEDGIRSIADNLNNGKLVPNSNSTILIFGNSYSKDKLFKLCQNLTTTEVDEKEEYFQILKKAILSLSTTYKVNKNKIKRNLLAPLAAHILQQCPITITESACEALGI